MPDALSSAAVAGAGCLEEDEEDDRRERGKKMGGDKSNTKTIMMWEIATIDGGQSSSCGAAFTFPYLVHKTAAHLLPIEHLLVLFLPRLLLHWYTISFRYILNLVR